MIKDYIPPLEISFIWNPSDSDEVAPILKSLRKSFSKDKDKPFSRTLNIPLFFYSSQNGQEAPASSPKLQAKRHVIFVFTSVNTLGKEKWKNYIDALPSLNSVNIVPIAVDRHGLGHRGSLDGLNCIRMYEWPLENIKLHATVWLAHEVYRFGFAELDSADAGKKSSISIFLSHAKAGDTGRLFSERIKQFIDNTNMNRFFDSNEISPGYVFSEEIKKYIEDSTLIAIMSDAYSSRFWCQREILLAKKHNRSIVVVNCLDDYEDRIFPAASNVPCVRIPSVNSISDRDILRILSSAITETIRIYHSMKCLEEYREKHWIENDCELISRPPEIRQIIDFAKEGKNKICYPEPPLYTDEANWHEQLDVKTFTPLWNPLEKDVFSTKKVGISISDVQEDGFANNHIHPDSLIYLSQSLAKHLLSRSATILYGGDLRPEGFSEIILDEAQILNDRIIDVSPHVENHLAWPLYLSDPEITSWRARYSEVMKTVEHEIPIDVVGTVDKEKLLPPTTPSNLYVWSRCLSEMRERSIGLSGARICAGGRLVGYKGKMPGVLEEIVITLNKGVPMFLLGAFGGVVGDVCKYILEGELPLSLTEDWQITHNSGYSDLQKIARDNAHESDYLDIAQTLQNIKISDLSASCGLDEAEYRRLMLSPFVDECVYIILKGLKAI